jgi:hypothetical protein
MMHNDTPRHHAHGRAHANITSRAGRKGRSARLRWIARLLVAEVMYVSAMRLGLAILVTSRAGLKGRGINLRWIARLGLAEVISIRIGLAILVTSRAGLKGRSINLRRIARLLLAEEMYLTAIRLAHAI